MDARFLLIKTKHKANIFSQVLELKKETTKMEVNYFKTPQLAIRIFKASGFWFTKDAGIINYIYGLVMHLIFVDIWLFSHLAFLFGVSEILLISETLCTMFIYLLLFSKSIFLYFKTEDIIRMTKSFEELVKFSEHPEMKIRDKLRARVDFVYKIFIAYWLMCLSTCFSGGIFPIFNNSEPPYKLAYHYAVPAFCDFEYNFTWMVAFSIHQLVSPTLYCAVNVAMDMMPSYFFNASLGLLEEVSDRMNAIGSEMTHDSKFDEKNYEELVKCIEIYTRIKSFLRHVEKFFSPLLFLLLSFSLFIICTTAFSLSTVSKVP